MVRWLSMAMLFVVIGACAFTGVSVGGDGGAGPGGQVGGGDAPSAAPPPQPIPPPPPPSETVSWPDAAPEMVTVPNNPWLKQRGKVLRRSEIERFPARYSRQTERILILALSGETNMQRGHRFNPTGEAVLASGWDVLDETMRRARLLGYEEVWFRGWSGGHPIRDEMTQASMPYPCPRDVPSQAWLVDWRKFRDRWTARGMRIGIYVGPVVTPNFGTQREPEHRFLTRADFAYLEETLAWLKQQGFDVAALDAMSLITAILDEPDDATWNRSVYGGKQTPARDKGLALELMRTLNRSERLQGMRLIAESEMPPGPHQAEMPGMIIVQSRQGPAGVNRVTIDTIPVLTGSADEVIVPGVEKIALIHGQGWTRAEYDQALRVLEEKGYRVAIDWFVLSNYQLGMLDIPGTPATKTP